MITTLFYSTYVLDKNNRIVVIGKQARGPSYAVELGRKDGLVSRASDVEGKLPQPTFNLNQLNAMFAANGLSQADMIALSGISTFSFL